MSSFLPQTIQEFLRVDETVVHLKAGPGVNFGSSEAAVTHEKRNNVCGVWLGLKIFGTNRLDFHQVGFRRARPQNAVSHFHIFELN